MASFNIHLAIGKRYLEKNHINNEQLFMKGIIEPDLTSNKDKTHYTLSRNDDSLISHLSTKVYLPKFLKENKIDNDYMKGVFLHLITDYLFFNDFFERDYLSNISYDEYCKDLYYSYDLTNDYLQEKYEIDLKDFIEEININIGKDKKEKLFNKDQTRKNILDFLKLDKFIEKVSNIDLDKYKMEILKANKNILP